MRERTEKAIRAALSRGGEGMHKIAARFGVGTGTVQRIKAEMVGPGDQGEVNARVVCRYTSIPENVAMAGSAGCAGG
jgi:hypothetical protein